MNDAVRDLLKLAVRAGSRIMAIYREDDFGVEHKADDSPLTRADSAAHRELASGLQGIPWEGEVLPLLSEEGEPVPYRERRHWKRYWLVDPLDGTKEFIKRNGEFTVNIALIEGGRPRFGVVYLPVDDCLYYGGSREGSWKLTEASRRAEEYREYGEKLRPEAPKDSVRVVASRSHLNRETEEYIRGLHSRFAAVATVSAGSSLKFCLVAEGRAHLYPRFAPTMEWDTAAAHAVCLGAGVQVTAFETGAPLGYNKPDLTNPWFLVSSEPAG